MNKDWKQGPFEGIYMADAAGDPVAKQLLRAQHFYHSLAAGPKEVLRDDGTPSLPFRPQSAHDERTADTQPVSLENVLSALAMVPVSEQPKPTGMDRFTMVLGYVADSLRSLMESPREKILREELPLPPRQVKQLTPNGMLFISRQQGETPRQKLRGCRQGIPSIVRRSSLDTSENRILKRFVTLADTLCVQRELAYGENALPEDEQALATRMQRWLRQEDVLEIRPQGTEPPNNVILGDIRYNRVWRGLAMLTSLDARLRTDLNRLAEIRGNQLFWQLIGDLCQIGAAFSQIPVFFDDESLMIFPQAPGSRRLKGRLAGKALAVEWRGDGAALRWGMQKQQLTADEYRKEDLCCHREIVAEDVAVHASPLIGRDGDRAVVDFCDAAPWFCIGNSPKNLPFIPRMQFWSYQEDDGSENFLSLDLGSARGVRLDEKSPTLTIEDLLDDQADATQRGTFADALADRLHRLLGDRPFTYLLPDDADEFALVTLRSALRIGFNKSKDARPSSLPRCIAAAIGHATSNPRITPGALLVFITFFHDHIILSPVLAKKQQKKYEKFSPRGIIWVRHPALRLERKHRPTGSEKTCYFPAPAGSRFAPPPPLSDEERGQVEEQIKNLIKEQKIDAKQCFRFQEIQPKLLVVGARACARFDKQYGEDEEAVLWKDHLPPLSALFTNEFLADTPFSLVSPSTTISPRLLHCDIPISENFVLAAGRETYTFPLTMGEKQDRSRYAICLRSSRFPLSRDTLCKLKLDYTYGEPMPYTLRFINEEEGLSVEADWRPYKEPEGLGDIPPAPKPPSLESLRNYITAKGHKIDILARTKNMLQLLASFGETKGEGLHAGLARTIVDEEATLCRVKDCTSSQEYTCGKPRWIGEEETPVFFLISPYVYLQQARPGRFKRFDSEHKRSVFAWDADEREFSTSRDKNCPTLQEGQEIYVFTKTTKDEQTGSLNHENYLRPASSGALPTNVPGTKRARVMEILPRRTNQVVKIRSSSSGIILRARPYKGTTPSVDEEVWFWADQKGKHPDISFVALSSTIRNLAAILAWGNDAPRDLVQLTKSVRQHLAKQLEKQSQLPKALRHQLAAILLAIGGEPTKAIRALHRELFKELSDLNELRHAGKKATYDEPWSELTRTLIQYGWCVQTGEAGWQKEVMERLVELQSGVFATTQAWKELLWRSPSTVFNLSQKQIDMILSYLEKKIMGRQGKRELTGHHLHDKRLANPTLVFSAEILLALLRLRGSDDEELRQNFSLRGKHTRRCRVLFNEIVNKLGSDGCYKSFRSSLKMEMDEPDQGEKHPPLLKLLHSCLTGEEDIGSIRIITTVNDDDDDDDES